METKEPFVEIDHTNPYYLGKCRDIGYYFYYEKERLTTLNHEFFCTMEEQADGYIIYADLCTIPDNELKKITLLLKKYREIL